MSAWHTRDSFAASVALGAAGVAIVVAGLILAPGETAQAWLAANLAILGMPLGALLILMIYALTGGRWGDALRPVLSAMAAMLPLPLVGMLVPVLDRAAIFPWTAALPESLPETARHKLAYLAPGFLAGRTLIVAAIWLTILWAIGGVSRRRPAETAKAWSIVGLVAYAITITVFATDWMIALDSVFYSTIYPLLEAGGELAGAFAAAIVALYLLGGLRSSAEAEDGALLSEDLANLLFGFVLLWVYLSFMQWLVIWSGDLPEEIGWYLIRSAGPWPFALAAIVVLQGVIPIVGLLSRSLKRSPPAFALLAGSVLLGHLLDVVWRVAPAFPASVFSAAMSVAAFVGLGGLGLAASLWRLDRPPRPIAGGAHA